MQTVDACEVRFLLQQISRPLFGGAFPRAAQLPKGRYSWAVKQMVCPTNPHFRSSAPLTGFESVVRIQKSEPHGLASQI